MTITQLNYFCAVCRYGSISKAAEELFISHPTVSVAIKSLENEFSIQLFTRSGNRVSLTRDGEAFYRKALDILQRCDEMYADFSNRPESNYRVHVGVPPIRSTILFPGLLEDFHKKYSIPVILHEYSSRRSLEKLQNGSLDCCLVNVEDSVLSGYNRAVLMKDHFVFLVSKESPLSSRKFVSAEDLNDFPLVLQSSDSALNTPITQAFSSAGVTPHVLLYSSQLTTIMNFVRENLGGAFFYSSMVTGDRNIGSALLQDDPAICSITLRPEIQNTFALVWPKGGYINRNVKTWISFVKKTLSD